MRFHQDIDVVMRTQLKSSLLFFTTPRNHSHLKTHFTGVLNGHVAKAPNPRTATLSPALAPELRSALKVAVPAQRIGAACTEESAEGMAISAV
jgi:hypothetical protein